MRDKFRIGHRVRIIKAPQFPEYVGTEHVVKTQRLLRKGATRKWWGYDIGLQINGVRVYPRQQSLERVYSSPAPGLQRVTMLEKELRA